MNNKKCVQCKKSMNYALANLRSKETILIVKVIVDDGNHYHRL